MSKILFAGAVLAAAMSMSAFANETAKPADGSLQATQIETAKPSDASAQPANATQIETTTETKKEKKEDKKAK
jgi:hypothetical protein